MVNYTTIQVTPSTRDALEKLKSFKRESYEEVLLKLLELVPVGDDEGTFRPEFRASLLRGMLDDKNGRTYSHEEVKKKLGLA